MSPRSRHHALGSCLEGTRRRTHPLLSFSIGLLLLVPFLTDVTYGELNSSSGTIKIVVQDFEQKSGDSRYGFLARSLPELIQVALMPYDQIRPVFRSILYEKKMGSHVTIYDPKLLREVGAQYLLTGFFVEFNGNLGVLGGLVNLEKSTTVKVGPTYMRPNFILRDIGTFAAEVVEAISKEQGDKIPSPRHFAVTCLRNESQKTSGNVDWFRNDFSISVEAYLRGCKWARVHGQSSERCKEQPKEPEELFSAGKLDAAFGGSFKVEGDTVFVYPELSFPQKGSPLRFAPVEGNLTRYPELTRTFLGKIRDITDAILTEQGVWRAEDLTGLSQDPEWARKRAGELSERGDLKMAFAVLDMCLAKNPDDVETLCVLGDIRFKQRRYKEAIAYCEEALKLRLGYSKALETLGDVYLGQQSFGESVKAYETALQTTSNRPGLLLKNRGRIRLSRQEPEQGGEILLRTGCS